MVEGVNSHPTIDSISRPITSHLSSILESLQSQIFSIKGVEYREIAGGVFLVLELRYTHFLLDVELLHQLVASVPANQDQLAIGLAARWFFIKLCLHSEQVLCILLDLDFFSIE